ncbi:YvcK family protein [Candidatus Daviesbacteria bacterium]|nr:YvcK family protein [Candidatus Daviesbacteria bacterium]
MVKIVSIAGGTGRYAVLKGLKRKSKITALYNITDSGGSSGILRVEHGILPPGDGIQAFAALAKCPEDEQFLGSRFFQGGVNGHRIGNFMYLSATEIFGSDLAAVSYLQKVFKPCGQVLPVSIEHGVDLVVKTEDGAVITGEHQIDTRGKGSQIIDAWLTKKAEILPQVRTAILEADIILFGPGDLWTSVVPHLLIDGLPQAVKKSKARKVMICNLVTKPGETDGYQASDFAKVVTNLLGSRLDDFIANGNHLQKNVRDAYLKFKQEPVVVDEKLSSYAKNVYQLPLATAFETIGKKGPMLLLRHHPQKTAQAVLNVWRRNPSFSRNS